jgi:hypothetical protein
VVKHFVEQGGVVTDHSIKHPVELVGINPS